ncbi:MAG: hypothetical protein GX647_00885 [Clostridiales bacterium]|mgnify:FL=1|jgi:hypothetical protein|nr:hypothetical protein [Clostridiales bacterium]OPZ66905.1 MAG: hypothetical protein BWY81_01599 [Firmicutes bacterium ADurb.Bin467]
MEQAVSRTGRRTGWSEFENNLLWETADEAQQQGLPLKAVFERIAEKTGRRPNSIRNYYYAQVQKREGGQERTARFVPFTQQEVDWLMEQVLTARSQGQSVRSCLQKLSGGDHSLMLRYQNKYRSIIKSRPDYVRHMVERLNARGILCDQPQVNHRIRPDMSAACQGLVDEARRMGDAELARALDTLTRHLLGMRDSGGSSDLIDAAQRVVDEAKLFLATPEDERTKALPEFCELLAERVGALEAHLPVE